MSMGANNNNPPRAHILPPHISRPLNSFAPLRGNNEANNSRRAQQPLNTRKSSRGGVEGEGGVPSPPASSRGGPSPRTPRLGLSSSSPSDDLRRPNPHTPGGEFEVGAPEKYAHDGDGRQQRPRAPTSPRHVQRSPSVSPLLSQMSQHELKIARATLMAAAARRDITSGGRAALPSSRVPTLPPPPRRSLPSEDSLSPSHRPHTTSQPSALLTSPSPFTSSNPAGVSGRRWSSGDSPVGGDTPNVRLTPDISSGQSKKNLVAEYGKEKKGPHIPYRRHSDLTHHPRSSTGTPLPKTPVSSSSRSPPFLGLDRGGATHTNVLSPQSDRLNPHTPQQSDALKRPTNMIIGKKVGSQAPRPKTAECGPPSEGTLANRKEGPGVYPRKASSFSFLRHPYTPSGTTFSYHTKKNTTNEERVPAQTTPKQLNYQVSSRYLRPGNGQSSTQSSSPSSVPSLNNDSDDPQDERESSEEDSTSSSQNEFTQTIDMIEAAVVTPRRLLKGAPSETTTEDSTVALHEDTPTPIQVATRSATPLKSQHGTSAWPTTLLNAKNHPSSSKIPTSGGTNSSTQLGLRKDIPQNATRGKEISVSRTMTTGAEKKGYTPTSAARNIPLKSRVAAPTSTVERNLSPSETNRSGSSPPTALPATTALSQLTQKNEGKSALQPHQQQQYPPMSAHPISFPATPKRPSTTNPAENGIRHTTSQENRPPTAPATSAHSNSSARRISTEGGGGTPTIQHLVTLTAPSSSGALHVNQSSLPSTDQLIPFDADELRDIKFSRDLNDYQDLGEIGRGQFGSVHKIRHVHYPTRVLSWKRLQYHAMPDREKRQLQQEVLLLGTLDHSNVIRCAGKINDRTNALLYLIMEYCDGGDLHRFLELTVRRGRYLPEEQICSYFAQLVSALDYCHNLPQKVLHRDLKPQNILLCDGYRRVKLGDFGLAKMLQPDQQLALTHVGTPYYMSPEVLSHKKYDAKSDVWALGCLLYEMTTGQPPYGQATSYEHLKQMVFAGSYDAIPDRYSDALRSLCSNMLTLEPKKRPSARQLMNDRVVQQAMVCVLREDVKRYQGLTSQLRRELALAQEEIHRLRRNSVNNLRSTSCTPADRN